MHTRRSFLALAVVVLLQGSLSAADWPQFRGPKADGISIEKGINKAWNQKPPALLWKTPLTDEGYAGISVVKGVAYVIDHTPGQDVVRAISIATGKDVWTYTYPDTQKANFGYSRATPTVNANRVYVLGRMGQLTCLEIKTGKPIWSRNIMTEFNGKKPNWNYAMSPVVDGNKLIVLPGGDNALVVALDKTTGKTIWQGGGTREAGYATPVITTFNGKKQYLIFAATEIVGIDASNGAELWALPWGRPSAHIPDLIVIGNSFYVTNSYGEGCGLVDVTATGASYRWKNKEMQSHMATPILADGLLYGTTDPGDLICIDPQTGTTKWRQPGFEKGPQMMVDGVLLVFDGKGGDLVMVDPKPDAYQELGRFKPLGGQSWTMPVVSDGKLFVRNTTTLACYNLK